MNEYSNSQNQAIFSIIVKPAHVFSGLILIIVGSLIIVYDYPQLEYLKNQELTEIESFSIQERLQIEFTAGIIVLVGGTALVVYGMIKKIKDSLVK